MAISALSVFPARYNKVINFLDFQFLYINYFLHLIGCKTINIPTIISSVHVVKRVSEMIVTDRTKAPNLAQVVHWACVLRKSSAPRTWIARRDNYVITEINHVFVCHLA